jgi:hypothetical protein
MLDQYALRFARAFTALDAAKVMCLPLQIPEGEREPTNREIAIAVSYALDLTKEACLACGMPNVILELDRLVVLVGVQTFAPRQGISQAIIHLQSRIKDDLSAQNFFRVSPEDVRLYGQPELFGSAVAKTFEEAAEDIQNAGNCLALGQPTACVFHLMRAMEGAVRKLGKRLKITIKPQTTWRHMTGQMDDKIKKMPDADDAKKRKKNNWEEARANLHHIGSVWRNNTMHPATSYTSSQAHDVLNAVRVFLNGLCAL